MNRYQRQMLLPRVGQQGQDRIAAARVLLVGCGALGTQVADQLARAGVGFLRIADRDIVELTNLQRQVLFDEHDARRGWPKAAAAAERLAQVNSTITVEPQVVDVHSGNVEALAGVGPDAVDGRVELIIDGTDNVATRYLINDVSVKHRMPWIYGACVGMEGRAMLIRPRSTPCLRCVFPTPPNPQDLPTCDTAGVLGPVAGIIGSLQAGLALQYLLGHVGAASMTTVDLAGPRFHSLSLADGRTENCPCCVRGEFEFLNRAPESAAVALCGRDAVQVRGSGAIALGSLAERWTSAGTLERNRFFVRCRLSDPPEVTLTGFADGRVIVKGTRDFGRAKAIYARFVGS